MSLFLRSFRLAWHDAAIDLAIATTRLHLCLPPSLQRPSETHASDLIPHEPFSLTLHSTTLLEQHFYREIAAINANTSIYAANNCTQCLATQEVVHFAALTLPVDNFVDLLINYCTLTGFSIGSATCHAEFASVPRNASFYRSDAAGLGAYWAQLYAKMSQSTGDMQAWCNRQFKVCSAPTVIPIDEALYFTPKPESAKIAPEPSNHTIDVLHISDWHLDPRYDIGSEGNCSQGLCCRPYSTNTLYHTDVHNPSSPASRFGSFYCDSPPDLALSSFTEMDHFFNRKDIAFTVFTGDIVSHDNNDQLSRAYVEYSERISYETFKYQMGNSPIYATLGNHDSLPQAYNTPNNINNGRPNAFSWNYELLSGLWASYGWLNSSEARYASTHYAGYAHTTKQGLRIISLNTDLWYRSNSFNYYNFSNPDNSGMLQWLANELAACEKRQQRAWIIGHVLSGYDGSNALPNPSALFQSIVIRFSPATIAAVFFGHTHLDQWQIFYDYAPTSLKGTVRNTTDIDYTSPLQMGFIGPSITPLTGWNAGYQRLQVDAKTFSVMGVQTYIANISNALAWVRPVWQVEYDARTTYNVGAVQWPACAPLNATFYDRVARQMSANHSLLATYNLLESKSSALRANCTSDACVAQKLCYIRSGSAAVGAKCGTSAGPN